MSKTCGECKHFNCGFCEFLDLATFYDRANCSNYADKQLTNGDKIIAGGNKALVKFHLLGTCDTCIYYNKEHTSHNDICLCPKDKTCADGIEAWLNAPAAESDKEEN